MRKIILAIVVASAFAVTAAAQTDRTGADYENLRGPFLTNGFWDNWSISMGAGINAWVRPSTVKGEEYKGFNKVTPMFQLGATKMLAPNYGVRLQGNYGRIKDYTSFTGTSTKEMLEPGKYQLEFNYWTIEADFLFNLSNAIGGYKAARLYNATLFTGFGYGRSAGTNLEGDRTTRGELLFNAGLLNTFRVTDALDIYAELKANVVSQGFAAGNATTEAGMVYRSSDKAGVIPSLTVGFIYKFKDRRFYKPEVCDTTPYENRISELERELAAAQALAGRVETVTETVHENVPLAVFFKIGKADLTDYEMLNIRYVADVIKKNPDTDKVYTIIGMADKETGNPQLNQRLSVKRAKVVKSALVKLGVSSDRLEIKALGDRVNPFELPEMNRVVVIE